jgi:hypothetical protein
MSKYSHRGQSAAAATPTGANRTVGVATATQSLVSATNASNLWDLRCEVREALVQRYARPGPVPNFSR